MKFLHCTHLHDSAVANNLLFHSRGQARLILLQFYSFKFLGLQLFGLLFKLPVEVFVFLILFKLVTVDLFFGIGYFSFKFLLRARPIFILFFFPHHLLDLLLDEFILFFWLRLCHSYLNLDLLLLFFSFFFILLLRLKLFLFQIIPVFSQLLNLLPHRVVRLIRVSHFFIHKLLLQKGESLVMLIDFLLNHAHLLLFRFWSLLLV